MRTGRNNNNRNREMGKIKEENWFGKMRFSGRGLEDCLRIRVSRSGERGERAEEGRMESKLPRNGISSRGNRVSQPRV